MRCQDMGRNRHPVAQRIRHIHAWMHALGTRDSEDKATQPWPPRIAIRPVARKSCNGNICLWVRKYIAETKMEGKEENRQ